MAGQSVPSEGSSQRNETRMLGSIELARHDRSVVMNHNSQKSPTIEARKKEIFDAITGEVKSRNEKSMTAVPQGYYGALKRAMKEQPSIVGDMITAYIDGDDLEFNRLGRALSNIATEFLSPTIAPPNLGVRGSAAFGVLPAQGTTARQVQSIFRQRRPEDEEGEGRRSA